MWDRDFLLTRQGCARKEVTIEQAKLACQRAVGLKKLVHNKVRLTFHWLVLYRATVSQMIPN